MFFLVISSILVLLQAPAMERFPEIQPGMVLDNLPCRQAPGQSYAAYLPKSYSTRSLWPVILIFEPAARGKLPVERFSKAAETFGYLLFASNNSRNYDEALIADSVEALWQEVMQNYPVDPKRIYVAGMSGGARVATRLADHGHNIAGVLPCAAGYGNGSGPSKDDSYVFAGMMGTRDFNFTEFKRLEPQLENAGIAFRMFYFDGYHGWPPESVCLEAVEWIDLQAMKRGLKAHDLSWLKSYKDDQIKEISSKWASGEKANAFVQLKQLLLDLQGLVNTDGCADLLQEYESSKELARQLKIDQKIIDLEQRQQNPYFQRLKYIGYHAYEEDQGRANLAWLKKAYPRLEKKAKAEDSLAKKAMYHRIQLALQTFCLEMMIVSMKSDRLTLADRYAAYGLAMNEKSPMLNYNLACLRTRQERHEDALDLLEVLVEKGQVRRSTLASDSDLDALRPFDRFKKMLAELGP